MPKKKVISTSPSLGTLVPAYLTPIDIKDIQLIDDKQLADLFGVDERTPAQWRYTGRFKDELPVVRIGRCCRYRLADAQKFIANHLQQNFGEEMGKP